MTKASQGVIQHNSHTFCGVARNHGGSLKLNDELAFCESEKT